MTALVRLYWAVESGTWRPSTCYVECLLSPASERWDAAARLKRRSSRRARQQRAASQPRQQSRRGQRNHSGCFDKNDPTPMAEAMVVPARSKARTSASLHSRTGFPPPNILVRPRGQRSLLIVRENRPRPSNSPSTSASNRLVSPPASASFPSQAFRAVSSSDTICFT
jgi:hypothetical protein